jgi:thiol:disulfide interchange protein DsbA
MKKLLSILWLAAFLPLTASAVELYQEGTHYDVIADKVTDKPEVIEVFSFWCPACYNFEPVVKTLQAKLPKGAEFRKVHADFMRFASPELQRDLTKAMLVGKALKQEAKFNKAIFEYIHKQRASIASIDDVRRIAQVQGIEASEFDKALKSFTVNGFFKRNQKEIAKYRGKVSGVPSFIVNGKYKVNLGSVRSADDVVELINFLLGLKD